MYLSWINMKANTIKHKIISVIREKNITTMINKTE